MAKPKPLPLLSEREVGDIEQEAKQNLRADPFSRRSRSDIALKWSSRFLRFLELHRATERQSLMLQVQVRELESENERLAADNAHLREEKRVIWEKTNAPLGTCHDTAL